MSEEIKLWSTPIRQLASQTLSATEYTLLPYCARAFQLKVRFGAESFPIPMEDDFELTEEALQSSDEYLGRRVHEFIKNISSSDSVLKIKQKMAEEALSFKSEFEQKLFKKCLEVFLSSVYAVWISHKNTLWREKKFMVSLDRHLLQGIIDYAYLNNDNQWIVVDFKTSVIHSPAHRQWLRAHYFGQLQAYSYALEKLTPYPVKEAKLVFLSDHHCEEVFSREELLLESLTGQSLEKGFVEKPKKNLKHCEFCYLKGVCKP
jgi:ATP-dependent exoDNAse (exonuclease V) beta subunit